MLIKKPAKQIRGRKNQSKIIKKPAIKTMSWKKTPITIRASLTTAPSILEIRFESKVSKTIPILNPLVA